MSALKSWQKNIPWVLGSKVRIPRVKFPDFVESSLELPTPGRSVVLIAIYGFLFYLIIGGIYLGIRQSIALGADSNGNPLWFYPSTSEAFVIESIVAGVIIFLGGAGFVLLNETTKNSFNWGYAIKLLVLGIILIVVCFGLLQWMIDQKGG